MKKIICLVVLISVISCKENKPQETISYEDRENLKIELLVRDVYQTSEAIKIPDTTAAFYKKALVNDVRFRDTILSEVTLFYQWNGHKTRWLYSNRDTKLLDSYLKVLEYSVDYGFNPETYRYSELKKARTKLYATKHTAIDVANLDKDITASFLLYAKHIVKGRIIDPAQGKKIWRMDTGSKDAVDLLLKVTDTENLEKTIEALHPNNEYYNNLRNKLNELNNTEDEPVAQFTFDDLKPYKIGYEDEKIELLRKNLEQYGYNFLHDSIRNRVDEELILTLKDFQDDMGLDSDGIPGERTLFYLNMTNQQKREILIINLERLRWLNKDYGKEYIVVNIPQFQLFAFDDNQIKFNMKVIVGKTFNPTPIFMDKMEYIVFRPTWSVPQSIIRKEMIPKMVNNPSRYTKRGFKIYENGKVINPSYINWADKSVYKRHFRFVEKPSEQNSLGLVKFIFPNSLSIYLHDTPTDNLFEKRHRAFSHGCVRVEKPAEFAAYLLRNQPNWNLERVKEVMYSGKKTLRVNIDQKILVQLIYITAYVDDANRLNIFNDVYNFDDYQLQQLKTQYGL